MDVPPDPETNEREAHARRQRCYGRDYSFVGFEVTVGKIYGAAVRFDDREEPDVLRPGHRANVMHWSHLQARHPVQMDAAYAGLGDERRLGACWTWRTYHPVDLEAYVEVPDFQNGHYLHVVPVLQDNDHWDTIVASVEAHVYRSGRRAATVDVARDVTLASDEMHSFRVRW